MVSFHIIYMFFCIIFNQLNLALVTCGRSLTRYPVWEKTKTILCSRFTPTFSVYFNLLQLQFKYLLPYIRNFSDIPQIIRLIPTLSCTLYPIYFSLYANRVRGREQAKAFSRVVDTVWDLSDPTIKLKQDRI